MFLIDQPYISEFLKTTLSENALPVIATVAANTFQLHRDTQFVSEERAIKLIHNQKNPLLYCTSENSIGWITENLSFSKLPSHIELFKDKLKFRRLIKPIFPDFYFRGLPIEELNKFKLDDIPLPFIIKPTVGFFSLGVHKVCSPNDWDKTVNFILEEAEQIKNLFPDEVLNTSVYIIEQCIEGDEYAVDAYFNEDGEPVILGIFEHVFSSTDDVSDRIYITSKEIIEANLDEFTGFLNKIGALTGLKNFPLHLELRRSKEGLLLPIEVNPLRFGGMCTTADVSFLAHGFNPYLYYHNQEKPDWERLLKGKQDKVFSIIVLDNSSGVPAERINSFDYEQLLSGFEKPLELRKLDHRKYPLFGFLFTETRADNFIELKNILDSDLTEFITLSG